MSETKVVVKKQAEEPKRKERIPLTGLRTKLELRGEEPGFHYVFMLEDNVDAALDGGYEFVTHPIKIGNRQIDAGQGIGAKHQVNGGGGRTLYLMRIPEEFFNEDQESIQKEVDASEEQLYHQMNSDGLSGTLQIGGREVKRR